MRLAIIVTLALAAFTGVKCNILPIALPNPISTLSSEAQMFINGLNTAVLELQALTTQGVATQLPGPNSTYLNTTLINLSGNQQVTVGTIALPLAAQCNQPTGGIVDRLSCHICSMDCTYVHNTYGGACGNAPNPIKGTNQERGPICLCKETPPTDGSNFTDIGKQCGVLFDDKSEPLVILAIQNFLRFREFGLQCNPPNPNGQIDSTGCNTDCIQNHQYASGTCGYSKAVATYFAEPLEDFNCNCAHNVSNPQSTTNIGGIQAGR